MTTWSERLKSRMKDRKLTQEELAEILGVSQSAVGHYVSGRRNPRKELMEKIADVLEVSLDWLAGKVDVPPVGQRDFFSVPILEISAVIEDFSHNHGAKKAIAYTPISTSWIAEQGYLAQKLCAIIVDDDAMSPKLNAGDIVVINRESETLINGGVFTLLVNGELHLRRAVRCFDNSWVIACDNTSNLAYRDQKLLDSEINNIQIIGHAVLAITSL